MHTLPLSLLPLLLLAPSLDGWLGIYLDNERTEAVVAEVIPDSPAARAGLQAGDELLAVGDQKTPDRDAFIAAIRAAKPDDRLAIQLRRDGREQVVVVKLGKRPEAVPQPNSLPAPAPAAKATKSAPAAEVAPVKVVAPAAPPAPAAAAAPKSGRGYLGLSVREEGEGVVADRVLADGPAKDVLVAGDRIVSINGQQVGGLDDLDRALGQQGPGASIELSVQGANGLRKVTIVLGRRPSSADAGAGGDGVGPRTTPIEASRIDVVKAAPPTIETAKVAPLAPKVVKARALPLESATAPAPAPAPATTTLPAPTPAPATAPAPAPAGGGAAARADGDIEAQLAALRAELAELRRQLEQLRRQGRE